MREKGFTLIELLLVIAILMTVASLILPVMFGVRRKALVIGCQSNMHQTEIYFLSYATENDGYIPRTGQDVEARNEPNQMRDPVTRIPSLKGFVSSMAGFGSGRLKILRCPADNGSFGQSYYPTPAGTSCWKYFGQSHQVNTEMYSQPSMECPGYNPLRNGPMYGANAVRRDTPQMKDPSRYMSICDMWSHWHNEIAVDGETKEHYINMLFFDGHIGGRSFNSSLEAKQYLNKNAVKRWWEPAEE
jgi:prepilin-type N-terminal cleavage/methylation domain-containing protein/prepilin-type processing-associated H-X9-DG protein